jgi:DNA-binding transcriptional ArsR family regulator
MSNAKNARRLNDEELTGVARHFKLLGEPMRLKILQAICRAPLPVNDIVSAIGATQANVSKHLALLAAAGIVTREKSGQNVFYGLKDPLTLKLCELVHTQVAG